MALHQEYLRTALSQSATFQAWCGAADAAAALARIHDINLPAPADGQALTAAEETSRRPCAVVWTAPEEGYARHHVSTGTAHDWAESGRLMLQLEMVVPNGADYREAWLVFANAISGILDDLWAKTGSDGCLAFNETVLEMGPDRVHPDNADAAQVDLYVVLIGIRWRRGLGGG